MVLRNIRKQSGWVLYDGPSELDGSRIVVVLTTSSDNRKTGNMAQTWILRADRDPVSAIQTGADVSICGQCPHRGLNGAVRTCYVNVGQAPLAVYRAWQHGSYSGFAPLPHLHGVRLGSYGDPAAVPVSVWQQLLKATQPLKKTGYTHQWHRPEFAALRSLCMASEIGRAHV